MTHLEMSAEQARQVLEKCKQTFIERRLLVQQWCTNLIQSYNALSPELKAKLPPIPGNTPEQLLPSIYVADPQDLDVEQYEREAAVLNNLQMEMVKLRNILNEEAVKCAYASMQQN